MFCTRFFVTLEEFAAFLLYKGSLGNWKKMGLRIGNRTQFHILPPKGRSVALQSAMNCFQWTPDAEPPAVLWLIFGCKVTNKWAKYQIYLSIFERENSNSFAWLVQELRDIVSKVIILSERVKSIHTFFFRACSLFLQSLWHLIWHLPEKCVLGYVLLPNDSVVSSFLLS